MTFRLSLALLGLTGWLTTSVVANDKDKVEVLARGPVHEAYAEPVEREPKPSPVLAKEPPKAIEELPPDQKPDGANVQWMPGYWAWDDDKEDYIWVSGFWRNAPPGRTWVPGSWRKAEGGYQWSGGFWVGAKDDQKAEVDYLPKPPAPLDNEGAATPPPSDDHTYVPGTWLWRDRWVWQPGYYIEHRPGWVWTAPHYRWTPAGYVYIAGYWDYPLDERGILFAPAYIPPAVYTAPAFVYTPTVVVREDCLYGAFFVRRGFGCYYFGDYFAPRYAGVGFVAWGGHVSASVTIGGWYDPLFSYYRCGYRADPFWRAGIVDLYCGRYRGDYLCPPRTLIQQNTVINNITNNTNVNNVNLNNVTMLSNLNEATRGGRRNLRTVSDADRRAQQDAARSVREVADRRATLESQIAGRPGAGKSASPRSLRLDTPPSPVASKSQPTPKTTGAGKVGSAPTAKLPAAPPPPKPTVLGKIEPKVGGNTPAPKSQAPLSKSSPPALPKSNPLSKGDSTPAAPKAGPLPKSDAPAPRTQPKSSPAIPRATPKSSPDVAPRPAPKVSPTIPKSSPSPARPPAAIPSVPKSSPPPARPPAVPRSSPPPSRPAPKASKSPSVGSLPPAASSRPPVIRGASPAPARSAAPPATRSIPRAPAAAPPTRSIPRAPAAAPPTRSIPRAPAAAPPTRSVPRAPATRSIPRATPSRPSPSISRPAPSVRRPAPAPARPAAPQRGRR
jgi:hypothetical protein